MIILLYDEKAGGQKPTIESQSAPDKAKDIWEHKQEINFALCRATQSSPEHGKQDSALQRRQSQCLLANSSDFSSFWIISNV